MSTLNVGISGEYRMVITKPSGEVIDTGWFENLILDSGLDRIGGTGNTSLYMRVGTGTSTPVITQSNLDIQLAASETTTKGSPARESVSPFRILTTYTGVFLQGAVVGNITEVGFGWATTGNTLFSRALIVDGLGDPVALTIVALDQLTVHYRSRVNPMIIDATSNVTINSISYGYTARALYVGSAIPFQVDLFGSPETFNRIEGFGGSVLITARGAGAALVPPSDQQMSGTYGGILFSTSYPVYGYPASVGTYTPGTFYKDSTVSIWAPECNPAGGILGLEVKVGYSFCLAYQILFSSPIPKDNTKNLVLTFRISWNRT